MNIENIIARIDNKYDPEHDLINDAPDVTKTDYDLAMCIQELQARIEELKILIDKQLGYKKLVQNMSEEEYKRLHLNDWQKDSP